MDQYIEFLSNHPILSVLWIIIAAMLLGSWFKSQFSKIRQINTQQLTLLVNRQDGKVVDIRAQKEFNAGHIAGAVHVNAEKAKVGELPGLENHKNKPIILVCNAGITASAVADKCLKAGFDQVYVLSGGMGTWQSAGLPTTK
ncbi:FIG136845: Rhodanese-related sulfurtransferase [Pseudoalteromonas luteoviolacea B = ATCC 29581]|nr:FIG136845: Rhodanese-related sulfurtransferase [Pseudoalteromonas luteoviolacea B = ATCC 29581]